MMFGPTLYTALSRLPHWTPVAATGGLLGLFVILAVALPVDHESYYVAFAGNNFLAINDIPRLLQAMGGGDKSTVIRQQSCLHPSGTVSSIVSTGNGMKSQWHTSNAIDSETYMTDYGVCSIRQLILGYDDTFYYDNRNGAYENDGENPCLENQEYTDYVKSTMLDNKTLPQFFVIADQTKRMAFQEYRDDALYSLMNDYIPLLKVSGAIPIVVANHGFWSTSSNMTGLDDLASFTSLIYEGARQYAAQFDKGLTQRSRIAPVGLAFLTVYEKDLDMWNMLTASDDIHSSVYGSFLTACVLYATITETMPDKSMLNDVKSLYSSVRLTKGEKYGFPNGEEALFLWKVARKVTLEGQKPKSFESYDRF